MKKSYRDGFKLSKKAKRNCVYLYVLFCGGDADTDHPKTYIIPDVTMENIDDHVDKINEEIEIFKTLEKVLDDTDLEYDEILKKFGEDVADLWESVPNDPQCDYQYKCYISNMYLEAYDNEGDLFTQYLK